MYVHDFDTNLSLINRRIVTRKLNIWKELMEHKSKTTYTLFSPRHLSRNLISPQAAHLYVTKFTSIPPPVENSIKTETKRDF